ncbi:hypothetical protein SPRG_10512 [Saprolegnia parasitica CBS 223.65]|uniref:EF-hand domain-containing protein n=1 Tax=Saprolegnia parasitica (strain CBS 223.65) TaxID=695850 RepID=A0A067BZ09_SAPPC|nr:hypothetical protein SPRG_10512 [Saprolegnia parasitica CBS 223.65]KDO23734.1 hypothetical protein SPRG_10512 [Saprolegnia parasitica CBS 223.65]|eukprot:XP_012205552.1 hypothetical protein SPRG_10512 [Saprolegnia parasitica CBS 223.65]
MDLMMRLKGHAFKAISDEFKVREATLGGDGLPLQDFVEIMLRALPKPKHATEKAETIAGLVDLFNDIDVNGDGTLEFNEFTSYCVDAGMVATRVKVAPLKYQYIKNRSFVDRTTQGASIEKLKWCSDLKRALAVEASSSCVKVYSADFLKVTEVYPSSPSLAVLPSMVVPGTGPGCTTSHAGSDMNPSSSLGGLLGAKKTSHANGCASHAAALVLDAEFLAQLRLLAVSSSNFVLSFYDTDHYEYVMENQTTVAQTLLRWCEPARLLFSTGNNKVLNAWSVARGRISLVKQLYHHLDVVSDVLAVPQYDLIVSCDLKRYIYLWDIQDCRPRGSLVGHTHGVRQMVFSPMNDLLVTAGFEFDAYGWDISSKQRIMTLSGHRASLVGVQLARFHTERAVTADITGLFKIWNIHRLNGAQAQLLESIAPASTIAHFNPRSFITLSPKRDIVAASCVLHIFESVKIQKHDEIPLRAFFQHSSNQFLGLTETSVNLWDGNTGLLLEEFTGLTQSSFVLCCQDALHRKLVVATDDGAVEVYNCTNLARVRRSNCTIGRIGSLHYDSKNKLIIATTGAASPNDAGGIFILDDGTVGECVLLRSLANVEVTASAFSVNASLVATAAGDHCIRCWDFETLQLQIVCRTETGDIHVVAFLDPYPVLVAADGVGNVFFFATSPQYTCNTGGCLHAFLNTGPSPDGTVVTTLTCLYHEDEAKHVLVTGDDEGRIAVWDLSVMLRRLRLQVIPEDKLKSKRRGYNAHCTFSRTFDADRVAENARRHTTRLPDDVLRRVAPKRDGTTDGNLRAREHHHGGTIRTGVYVVAHGPYWDVKDVTRLASWVAHADSITGIEVNDRPNVLVSCAFDARMYVWDWRGNCLGCLTTNEDDMRSMPWHFAREDAKRARERQEIVAEIVAKLDMTPDERERAASERRQIAFPSEKVNPLLQTMLFAPQHKKKKKKKDDDQGAMFCQKAQRKRVQTPEQIKAIARHTSLLQVRPLIHHARPPAPTSAEENDEHDDSPHRWSLAAPEPETQGPAAPTLTERLLRLEQQERLVSKTDAVYVNLVQMQHDKTHKTSAVKRNLMRNVDIELSPFLEAKLGPDKPALQRRPNTAPLPRVVKPLKRTPASLTVLPASHNDRLRRLTAMRASSSAAVLALLAQEESKDAAATLGKLTRINDIISTATSYTSPDASMKAPLSQSPKAFSTDEQAVLRAHAVATQERYEATMRVDGIDLATQLKLARLQQTKLEKEKRMQRYMAQKQRDAHSKIGEALRHTSVLFASAPTTDVLADAAKQRRFGMYSTKEVMVIIRLFWALDTDNSGNVTETELNGCRGFFESMGYSDMATIFQTIDADASGHVTLAELFKICFAYATSAEIHEMVMLERLGRAPTVFAEDKPLTPDQIAELREIFTVFDRDRSGTVSFAEVLDALQYRHDDDDAGSTLADLAKLYEAADNDGNKELSFDEFVQLLQELYRDKPR